MFCRRFILTVVFLISGMNFAYGQIATERPKEKMVYVSMEVDNGDEILKTRILKSAILKLSQVSGAHFIILNEGQGKILDDTFETLYYLRLKVSPGEKADISLTLFDEKSKKMVKKVEKKGFPGKDMFRTVDDGMVLVLEPLKTKK